MKLSEIQQKLKCGKSQFNAFGKYNYRSCEDILEAVKPLLEDSILILSDDIVQIGDRYYVRATVEFASFDIDKKATNSRVTAYAREEDTKKGMDAAQITGAASSYARKYALSGLFLLDDSRDPDTQDNAKQEKKPTPPESSRVDKATDAQKAVLNGLMKQKTLTDAQRIAFYSFVMHTDSKETADNFIKNFDKEYELWKKA